MTSKELIETLYPFNASLVGGDYDKRLDILKQELPLDIIAIPSGTEFGSWKVPQEWIIRDAWVKYKGKKILDWKTNPHALALYSIPFRGKLTLDELKPNLYYKEEYPDVTPHVFKFYENTWGFCLPKVKRDKLKEGEYEVFIDSELRPSTMNIGVHTIVGDSPEEVLLFAHLDHPYQANDNLSGVACLLEVAEKLKTKYTVKLIFCPETIGSIAYAHTQDLTNVKFCIAVDICGNDDSLLLLKAYEPNAWINRVAHCAFQAASKPYRKAPFRATIGSDETVFNDPKIGIPSLCLTTHGKLWRDYHTDQDTPDKIVYEKITETADMVCKIIEIAERDYIPVRNFIGQPRRSKYDMQSFSPQANLTLDYFFYLMDGKKSLTELCADQELGFDQMSTQLDKLIADGQITKKDRSPDAR